MKEIACCRVISQCVLTMKQRLWLSLVTCVPYCIDRELYKAIDYLREQVRVLVAGKTAANRTSERVTSHHKTARVFWPTKHHNSLKRRGRVDAIWLFHLGMLCFPCVSSLSIEECHNILPCERTSTSLTPMKSEKSKQFSPSTQLFL